jgi:hypothetical protein
MGFRQAKAALIKALESGDFEHEERDALAEKHLLAIGEVDRDFVVGLLHRTRGDQYTESPHDWDDRVTVHVFKPVLAKERWYVKAYFLDPSPGHAFFMSVHKVK